MKQKPLSLLMQFQPRLQLFDIGGPALELFVPDPGAVKEAYEAGKIPFPYWSQVWPSALALSRFLWQNKHLIQDKNLLELAAGLGMPSLVAAPFARSVFCTDHSEEAVDLIARSANRLHYTNFKTAVLDWKALPENLDPDVLLLSDVNYDPSSFEILQRLLRHFLEKSTSIFLATPQRLVAKTFVGPLESFCQHQEEIAVMHRNNPVMISVLVLRHHSLKSP